MSSPTLKLNPAFRVDHVGSLVRPQALFDARKEGNATSEDLRAKEDAAVAHVVQLQRDLGLATITDGEMRREVYFEGVFNKMEGITLQPQRPLSEFQSFWPWVQILGAMGMAEYPTCFASGKIKRTTPWFVDDFKALKALVPPEDVGRLKVSMCPPNWYHQRHGSDGTYDKSIYASDDEYFDAVATAYRAEIEELYGLGCRRLQFDDSTFCFFCDDDTIKRMREAGVDPERLLELYIGAINRCTADRPADLNIGVHMCHGNMGGMHFSEGGYASIAEKVFNTLDVDTFYLEYDTERSGNFAPLKHMPPHKAVVLGLVTTKSPKLEDPELLKTRIHEAAEIMANGVQPRSKAAALNQLCISGQCGFASIWQGNPVTEEDEKAKIRLLQTVAKEIWSA